jgi:hypothetical protein
VTTIRVERDCLLVGTAETRVRGFASAADSTFLDSLFLAPRPRSDRVFAAKKGNREKNFLGFGGSKRQV